MARFEFTDISTSQGDQRAAYSSISRNVGARSPQGLTSMFCDTFGRISLPYSWRAMEKENLALAFILNEVRSPCPTDLSLSLFVLVRQDLNHFPISLVHDQVLDCIIDWHERLCTLDIKKLFSSNGVSITTWLNFSTRNIPHFLDLRMKLGILRGNNKKCSFVSFILGSFGSILSYVAHFPGFTNCRALVQESHVQPSRATPS